MDAVDYQKHFLANIGSNLRKIRVLRGMTQKDLALRCNMEKASISRIESGKTNITMMTLLQLAASLDTAVLELLVPDQSPKGTLTTEWKSLQKTEEIITG